MRVTCVLAILISGAFAEIDRCVAGPNGLHQCNEEVPLSDATSLLQRANVEVASAAGRATEALVSTDPAEAPVSVAAAGDPIETSVKVATVGVPPAVPQVAAYFEPWTAFQSLEASGDGYIDAPELGLAMMEGAEAGDVKGEKNTNPFSPAELAKMISDIDTDKDQKVSYAEFEANWLSDREKQIAEEGATAVSLKAVLDAGAGSEPPVALVAMVGDAPALPALIQASEEAQHRRALVQEAGGADWWHSPPPAPPPPPVKAPNSGSVAALYTYGAPGTAKTPLKNYLRADGCFPGARVYTSARVSGWFYGFYYKSDPVAWMATHNAVSSSGVLTSFRHPLMNVLELKEWESGNPSLHKCGQHTTEMPERDFYYATSLHHLLPGAYKRGLYNQQHYPVPRTLLAHAALAYETGTGLATKAADTARVLVASVVAEKDAVYLLQDPSTFECTVTFKGSDSLMNDGQDWANNILGATQDSFCGFDDVHHGFKEEILGLLQDAQFQNLRSKLPKCSAVVATGHSLGGAQAELFAACANHGPAEGTPGYSDYQLLAWTWGEPQAIAA